MSKAKKDDLFTTPTLNRATDSKRFIAVPSDQRRSERLGIKVTKKERLVLERLSKLHGKSISNVVRDALQKYVQA